MKSKLDIVLENKSVIKCVPTSRGAIRGHAVDAFRVVLGEDVGSGVSNLHVDTFYERDIPANNIKIDFVVARALSGE